MKKCFKCNIEKPLDSFYKHKGNADGLLGKCKDCTKSDSKERIEFKKINDPSFIEKERSRSRDKYYRLSRKPISPENKKTYINTYKINFPEKVAAKSLSGKVKRKYKTTQLHHWSYNLIDAKDVIEISVKDHYTAHRFLIYDQTHYKYRTTENLLLETKDQHCGYLKSLGIEIL